jgi:hypothetical protein
VNNVSLIREAAALAGYTIDSTTGADPTNKTRAQRRLNMIKTDVVSRYGGKWSANYREGWLALGALYNTGTANFTQNSNTVVGVGTVWTTSMKGQKMLGGDNSYYKIASVQTATSLTLTQPYQGTTITSQVYQIWQDEYRLYPEAWSVAGFIDYFLPQRMTEAWGSNMKESYPFPTNVEEPTVYTILHKEGLTASVSAGTVSVTLNTNVWTGVGTTWLTGSVPIEPGFEFTANSNTYHVKRVNSDTELETYQMALTTLAAVTYSSKGKNSIVVRFRKPTNQRIVHYWYYAKDFPFLNDNDEDWIAEQFPRVIVNGMAYFDYIDKNDVARGFNAQQVYEDSIRNMKVAVEAAYTGIRTLGIYVPPEARE